MTEGVRQLQEFLNRELLSRQPLCILEAGCGSASNLDFGGQAQLVGIDISEKQLQRNTVVHEKIVGDIQSYEFPKERFDCIVCNNVLEHLRHPELALKNFSQAIKPHGLVILGLPNVFSIKGLVTKLTPHTLHVLAYRYFWGVKDAGQGDTPPFKAYLRLCISEDGIRRQAQQLGLKSVYHATEDVSDREWLRRKRVVFVYLLLKKLLQVLSVGRIGDSELLIVLRKGDD